MLSHSLLQVSHATKRSAQILRQVEEELGKASQLKDMRELRTKLGDCLTALCAEAEVQEARHVELRDRLAVETDKTASQQDPLTGLGTLKIAEARMQEISGPCQQGFVIAFFLKNLEFINRRSGFPTGDDTLRRFAEYLRKNFKGSDLLFRWRGPCFVAVADGYGSLQAA